MSQIPHSCGDVYIGTTAGVSQIPHSCGDVYIGTTNQGERTSDTLPIAPIQKITLETGHKIMFEETKVLPRTSH